MQTPLGFFVIAAAVPACEWLLLKLFRLPPPNKWQRALITGVTVAAGALWIGYKQGWDAFKLSLSLSDLPFNLLTLVTFIVVGWAIFHMPYTPREYQADRTKRP